MNRHDDLRDQVRIARTVRERLRIAHTHHQHDALNQLDHLHRTLERLSRGRRRLEHASARHWQAASRRTIDQLRMSVADLAFEIESTRRVLSRTPPRLPTLRELVAELDQLASEFGDWGFRPDSQLLSVVLGPITLEHVELGRFRLQLPLLDLADREPQRQLEVIALEPNPAAGSPGITHPHVSDERLCLGEASEPVRRALREGRLCDFFIIVQSTLEHYNSDSPYVTLEDWESEPCGDCGDAMHMEQRSVCERCGGAYCEQCIGRCEDCEDMFCHGCLEACRICGEPFCPDCRDQQLCRCCIDELQQEENDDESEAPRTPQGTTQTSNAQADQQQPINAEQVRPVACTGTGET